MEKYKEDKQTLETELKKIKFNINMYDEDGYSLLHWAAKNGYIECIEVLIIMGANLKIKTLVFCNCCCHNWQDGESVRSIANKNDQSSTERWLEITENNCSVFSSYFANSKDFFKAIEENNVAKVRKCLQDPNCKFYKNSHGMGGLHFACCYKAHSIISL